MDRVWDWFCKISLIIFIIICINSMLGDLLFRFQYSRAKVSQTVQTTIDTTKDPIQTDLQNAKYIKAYGEHEVFALQPQAKYSISGLVVTKNSNFWFRDIMRSRFDDICLIDFGIVWGDLAQDKEKLYKHWKFKSKKTLGQARQLSWRAKPPYDDMPWSLDYVSSHISHTHMIPANSNVMSALLKIKKNDIVKIDGYLVDIYSSKSETIAKTSMSRTDRDSTSRGYGACEDMYVKRVQIGNKVYK